MSVQENKQTVKHALEEIWNRGNMEWIGKVYHPAFAARVAGQPYQGLDAYRLYVTEMREAFPDIHIAIEDQFGENDKVVTRYELTGTHTGSFIGWDPTHAHVRVTGVTISRLYDGQIRVV